MTVVNCFLELESCGSVSQAKTKPYGSASTNTVCLPLNLEHIQVSDKEVLPGRTCMGGVFSVIVIRWSIPVDFVNVCSLFT